MVLDASVGLKIRPCIQIQSFLYVWLSQELQLLHVLLNQFKQHSHMLNISLMPIDPLEPALNLLNKSHLQGYCTPLGVNQQKH